MIRKIELRAMIAIVVLLATNLNDEIKEGGCVS